ncbi:hypothetical protein [Mucilaginibacter sp.]
MNFVYLFSNAFDTFKVFDSLTIDNVNESPETAPQSIWQILNHLVILNNNEIAILEDKPVMAMVSEPDSWIENKAPVSQDAMDKIVNRLQQQVALVKTKVAALGMDTVNLEQKLFAVQNFSIHLSFHLGEIVLLRRMAGTYPLPKSMRAFLAS